MSLQNSPLKPLSLAAHPLNDSKPVPEAIRALEELLESGERLEQPSQNLLVRYPALLASIVVGNADGALPSLARPARPAQRAPPRT